MGKMSALGTLKDSLTKFTGMTEKEAGKTLGILRKTEGFNDDIANELSGHLRTKNLTAWQRGQSNDASLVSNDPEKLKSFLSVNDIGSRTWQKGFDRGTEIRLANERAGAIEDTVQRNVAASRSARQRSGFKAFSQEADRRVERTKEFQDIVKRNHVDTNFGGPMSAPRTQMEEMFNAVRDGDVATAKSLGRIRDRADSVKYKGVTPEEYDKRYAMAKEGEQFAQASGDARAYLGGEMNAAAGRGQAAAMFGDIQVGGGTKLAEAEKAAQHGRFKDPGKQAALKERLQRKYGTAEERASKNTEPQTVESESTQEQAKSSVGGKTATESVEKQDSAAGEATRKAQRSIGLSKKEDAALDAAIMRGSGENGAFKFMERGARERMLSRTRSEIEELEAQFKKGSISQDEAMKQRQAILAARKRGPITTDYIIGNNIHGKAAGGAVAAGVFSAIMGDGRRSNAELYSSPF